MRSLAYAFGLGCNSVDKSLVLLLQSETHLEPRSVQLQNIALYRGLHDSVVTHSGYHRRFRPVFVAPDEVVNFSAARSFT